MGLLGGTVAGAVLYLLLKGVSEHGLKEIRNLAPLARPGGTDDARREQFGRNIGIVAAAEELAVLNGVLEPLLPFLVKYSRAVPGLPTSGLRPEALVELNANAVDLRLALNVHLAVVEVVEPNIACASGVALNSVRAVLNLSPVGEAVGGGVADDDSLLPLELLLGPFGALPFSQACDFGIGEAEAVEGAEEATMPRPTSEANAVGAMGVVEAGVFGLVGLEVAVERVGFLADLRNEIALKKGVEILGVVALGAREHVIVHDLVDGAALHLGGDAGGPKIQRMLENQ